MFIKELRRQTYTGVDTLVVIILQCTILVSISYGYTVRHILQSSGHGQVMIRTQCHAIDFFLPVYICIAQLESLRSIGMLGKSLTEFFSRQYIHILIYIAYCHVSVIVEGGTGGTVSTSLLGSDDDDTIGSTRTVNSCGRSILQYCKGSNVIRIDGTDRSIAYGYSIDNNQRIIICRQRGSHTDTDGTAATRCTIARHDIHTSNFTHQSIFSSQLLTFVQLIRFHGQQRSGHVAFLHLSVADDYYFVQQFAVFLHGNYNERFVCHGDFLPFIADTGDGKYISGSRLQCKIAVHIGNSTYRSTFNKNVSSDNRFTGSILHMPFHHDVLC